MYRRALVELQLVSRRRDRHRQRAAAINQRFCRKRDVQDKLVALAHFAGFEVRLRRSDNGQFGGLLCSLHELIADRARLCARQAGIRVTDDHDTLDPEETPRRECSNCC